MSDVEQTHVRPISKRGSAVQDERSAPVLRKPLPNLLAEECLVVGETGADWSAGIAAARRRSANLALITQWAGEQPEHFAARVASRLAKRRGFAAVVLVCSGAQEPRLTQLRQTIIEAAARSVSEREPHQVCVVCQPDERGGIPAWAPRMADAVLARSTAGISVALAS